MSTANIDDRAGKSGELAGSTRAELRPGAAAAATPGASGVTRCFRPPQALPKTQCGAAGPLEVPAR